LVVLDEFHYLADPQRGPVWEESVILAPLSSTLLMLSASISNPDQIAAWITEVRAKQAVVVQSRTRPVELRLAFYHPHNGVIPLLDDSGNVHPLVNQFYEAEADAQRMRPKQRGRRRGWKR
jgi:superfamily II RNA helicase